jgi:oligopeptide/dipeptide ABC transporter ATP-binding protein
MMPATAAQDSGAPTLLAVEAVSRHFQIKGGWLRGKGVALKAVDGVSFHVAEAQTLALVGESGCGKSTLARTIVGLQRPTSGRITVAGRVISELRGRELLAVRKELQLIFQDPYSSLNPRMTVASTLAEPLRIHGLGDASQREQRVKELLATVGLSPAHAQRYPHQFSGGQRQRIGIARALAVEPKLIVCDEPVSSLDVSVQAQIINLLSRLQRELGLGYLFVAHDLALVKHFADRVAVMYLGKIMELADKSELFARPRHPYTQALLSSVPRSHPKAQPKRIMLHDDMPSPIHMPAGCRFHTRCPYARERCRVEVPELRGQGHQVACHFWEEIAREQPAPAAAPVASSTEHYVTKLMQRFRQTATAAETHVDQ